jgi:glycosyltransferase involved in cell wall biosynthesis
LTGTISVAMCTFNGERFLRQQLESIASQERRPDELVVCDDGSSDSTNAILADFAQRAPFSVRIVRNCETLGSTKNFEKAIGLCGEEFIALCDQDDVWEPNKLARLMESMADTSMAGVFSDAQLIDVDAQMARRLWQLHRFDFKRPDDLSRDAAVRLLLKHDVVTGATLMFQASVRDLLFPIPAPWVHDGWIAWMLVLYRRLTFVAEPLVRYRVHPEQQLGVGRVGRKRVIQHGDNRLKFAAMATQFEALRNRWIARPGERFEEYLALIENKIAFLRRRSQLPRNPVDRARAVLGLAPSYAKFARGLSSMRSDLFLPSEGATCWR